MNRAGQAARMNLEPNALHLLLQPSHKAIQEISVCVTLVSTPLQYLCQSISFDLKSVCGSAQAEAHCARRTRSSEKSGSMTGEQMFMNIGLPSADDVLGVNQSV